MTREQQAPGDWYKRSYTPPQGMTAAELMEMEFEPTRWVVPDILPEGVSLLVGKPKKGKSWMGLGWCESVAVGGVAFGIKRVEQGDTLYLALEDNMKRLRRRLKKILNGSTAPDNMHLYTEWPRLDEGGAEQLDEWLTEHPDARLVVIDTLAKIRNEARGQNIYAEDYAALAQLLPLAATHRVAIVVVHHLRKMAASDPLDEISSSTGLTAGVDGVLILRRTPGSKGPTLYVDGRDIEEPAEYALSWNINTATWTIEGDAEEVHLSKERADILLTLNRNRKPMTPREVTDTMPNRKYNNVKYLMWTMLGDGQLLKDDKGRYYPTNPTNPTNPANSANSANPASDNGDGVSGIVDDAEAPNPTFADTYAENGTTVSGVSGVSEDSGVGKCQHGTPEGYPCDDCEINDLFGAEPKVVSIESGEPYDVYVGRGKRGTKLEKSKWHNPYVVGKDGTRDECLEKYERHLKASPLMAELPEIKGKTLACHCAPKPCHADVLLRLANNNPKCDHGPNDFCDECVGP
jgi:AAA domain/Domain of unknown function (DUF4326)